MEAKIKFINIAAAALLTQFLLAIILFIGAVIVRRGEGFMSRNNPWLNPRINRLPWAILLFSLVAIGFLLFSDEFVPIWAPLFGNTASFPTVRTYFAIIAMFAMNILCVGYLISLTGGSQISPFGAEFFTLPALAIFLREPVGRVIVYVVAVTLIFTGLLIKALDPYRYKEYDYHGERPYPGNYEQHSALNIGYWFVSTACLALTTLIGYLTTPR